MTAPRRDPQSPCANRAEDIPNRKATRDVLRKNEADGESCRGLVIQMRERALAAIRLYQRWISPHKGFRCAYRHHTGRASCSQLGYRAVRRYGVRRGLALLRLRTRRCGIAHRRHAPPARPMRSERGACDLSCDLPCHGGCDGPASCDGPSDGGNARGRGFIGCCDCAGCDLPTRRRDKEEEQHVHLPPRPLE